MRTSVLGTLLALASASASLASTYNVRDFGARGDKTTNDAPAIQAAIDACNKAGGGEVLLPSGNYFSGKLRLRSRVTLKLEAGATLWASGKPEDYEPKPGPEGNWYLLVAENEEDIAVVGDGQIEGVGQDELDRRTDPDGGPLPPHRFGILRLANCNQVRLRDFRILYSDWHTVVFFRCEKVFVDNISIINNFFRTNSDGIDPESCKDVFISNCYIIAGDDCICPKTEKGFPLENLVVQNCILESVAAAFKLGTGSSGDFRDIKVANCVIRNSGVGLGVFIKDGGTAERLSFSNISIETTRQATQINSRLRNNITPVYIDIERRDEQARVGAVRDVTFSDLQIVSDNGVLIQGMPERAIENLTLRNLSFRVTEAFDFSKRRKRAGGRSNPKDDRITKFIRQPAYITLAHIDGLTLDNVRVLINGDVFAKYERSAVAVFESKDVVLRDIQRRPAGGEGGLPVITLNNCQQALVANCLALPGTPAFVGLSGVKTTAISLCGNDLSHAAKAVVQSKEVAGGAVRTGSP